MSEDSTGKGTDQESHARNNGPNIEEQPLRLPPNRNGGDGPADHERSPDPPNWVEKGTLLALILTLFAAGLAAFEADRLARDTEIALGDARTAPKSLTMTM